MIQFNSNNLKEQVPLRARLFANENPEGPTDGALLACREALQLSNLYQFGLAEQFARQIAQYEGLDLSQVLIGSGSCFLLKAIALALSSKGGHLLTGDPVFDFLPASFREMNREICYVPLLESGAFDLDGMFQKINADTALIYICNPNNPTGVLTDPERLRDFIRAIPFSVPVLVDEAYIEFSRGGEANSVKNLLFENHPLIISRTFSKIYGMASLRVGYLLSSACISEKINIYSDDMLSVSVPSLKAAMACYQDHKNLLSRGKRNEKAGVEMTTFLRSRGIRCLDSDTNFILYEIDCDPEIYKQKMRQLGIAILTMRFASRNWCRISLGADQELEYFKSVFMEL